MCMVPSGVKQYGGPTQSIYIFNVKVNQKLPLPQGILKKIECFDISMEKIENFIRTIKDLNELRNIHHAPGIED